jgi:phosphoenolpyruvate carboxykinase (GTP)
VEAIETPIGYLPKYDDLKNLFETIIDKKYPKTLYDKQFSLYIDNILARIDLQLEAYEEEENLPEKLFEVLKEQRTGLETLKNKHGAVVTPDQLEAQNAS